MPITNYLMQIFYQNYLLFSFIIPFIAGEIGITTISFLVTLKEKSILESFILVNIAILILDSIWFFAFHWFKLDKLKEKLKHSEKIEKHLQVISKNRDGLIIFLSKLLIGTRILTILYISSKKIKYKTYLKFDILPTIAWNAILFFVGWAMAKGFKNVLTYFKDIQLAITYIILSAILLYLILKTIRRWLEKRQKRLV